MKRFGKLLLLTVSAAALTGCYSDYYFECQDICETYDDCATESFESSVCDESCENRAEASLAFSDRVLVCDNCLDEFVTSSDECRFGFECNDECEGIIPAFPQP